MGLFSGPRSDLAEGRERGMTWPWPTSSPSVAFGSVDLSGTGSLQSVAVRSSIDLICSLVSELPLDVFRGTGSDRQSVSTPANLQDPGGDDTGLEDWLYRLLQSWLARGNAYGIPVRDRLGYLRGVDLVDPDTVGVTLDADTAVPSWTVNGRPAPGLLHRRVNPMAGVLLGFSPVEAHAVTILTSIAAGRFGSSWFAEGTHPQSLLVNTESTIDAQQAREVLARWRAMKSGTREPAVLGKGWEFRALSITPEESQFLATQGFSEAQCCRIFGPAIAETLGYESGGSMTYANVQDRRSDLLVFSLNRWARRAERLLSSMLPAPQYVKLNRDALLESTTLARYEAHGKALDGRWKTINEVRRDEDMPPVEWGDEPFDAKGGQQPPERPDETTAPEEPA